MRRPEYDVWMDDRPDPIRVTVTHADQLVGEQTAPQWGIPVNPSAAPQAHATLYVWCALRRMGADPGDWPTFKTQTLIGFQPVQDDDGDQEAPTGGDPTHQGQRTA